jgi:hypothetical protein
MSNRVFAITSVYEDSGLLPHFLDHYARLGVERIFLVVRSLTPDELLQRTRRLCESYPAEVAWYQCSHFEDIDKATVETRVLRQSGVDADDYVMHLDLDEFHEYPVPLQDLVRLMNRRRAKAVRGTMLDRVTCDGSLAPIRLGVELGEQFPIGCDLTRSLLLGWTQKIMLCAAHLELRDGVNHTTQTPCRQLSATDHLANFLVHHFKWTSGLTDRIRARLRTAVVSSQYRDECHRLLDAFGALGRIDLTDPKLNPRTIGALRYPV